MGSEEVLLELVNFAFSRREIVPYYGATDSSDPFTETTPLKYKPLDGPITGPATPGVALMLSN